LTNELASRQWLAAVARLVASGTGPAAAPALVAAIGEVVDHQGTCMLAFSFDAPPEIVHHSLEPAGVRHYVDRYLAGPYLLDPLYQLATAAEKPGVCRYRDATPDRFHSSEYYRRYCERTHLGDEMDYLLDVTAGTTLAFVVARRERRFTRTEIGRLRSIEAVVHAAMKNAWLARQAAPPRRDGARSMHRRLTECFESFGSSVLTEREQQITRLLLRGFSTKAIARELEIAPGTVMVHKRNLFAKFGITSQFELFSRFIQTLSED